MEKIFRTHDHISEVTNDNLVFVEQTKTYLLSWMNKRNEDVFLFLQSGTNPHVHTKVYYVSVCLLLAGWTGNIIRKPRLWPEDYVATSASPSGIFKSSLTYTGVMELSDNISHLIKIDQVFIILSAIVNECHAMAIGSTSECCGNLLTPHK